MTSTSPTYHGISPPSPLSSWDANSSAWYLLNFLQQNFMSQMYVSTVSTPTRFNNILDLVISDSDRLIHHTEVQQTNQSDHDLVRVTLPFNPKATPKPEIPLFDPDSFRCFDIHQADYDRINLYLHSPEHRLGCSKEQLPPADFPDLLYRTTFQACALFTPVKVITPPSLSKPARFRRTLSRKKRKLNARLNALQSHHLHPTSPTIQKLKSELNIIQLKIKDSIYSQLKFKESKVIQSIKDNPRFFVSFAKQKSKVKSSIAPPWTQMAPSILAPRAWQTPSSLNTPLSLATLMISTLRHRFSTPSYLSFSSTSPLPQPISRKLLRKLMRTPPVEISISVQKSFVNVEPTYPTPSTLSGRNLLINARFLSPAQGPDHLPYPQEGQPS